ncbi:MAG: MBL fold metallo-hydrolase [Clostridia bacterium]|nr:MBL fold metallo-hydrolase [Clostridia bacterium]
MRLCSISSGSSGNATFVECGGSKLLVDCGISGKALCRELETIGVAPNELRGILVTHEHIDHIKGVGILSRKFNLPIYATVGTWNTMIGVIGEISYDNIHYIEAETPFLVENAFVAPFSTPHDAAESVGFRFEEGRHTLAIATDIGAMSASVYEYIQDADIVLLESNHDIDMLLHGPYPEPLKRRILSSRGHLSNADCALVCRALLNNGTRAIVLAHLSNDNNTADLAFGTVAGEIEKCGAKIGSDIDIYVANRHTVGEMIAI